MPQGGNNEKDIELASFLVRIKPRIIFFLIVVAFVILGLLLAYALWFWGNVAVQRTATRTHFRTFLNNFGLFSQMRQEMTAQSLHIIGSASFTKTNGNMDAIALVENPNTQWSAHVDYHFNGESDGFVSAITLRPKERRLLGRYDILPLAASSPELVFNEIKWKRVDSHTIFDPAQFIASRAQFEITKPTYTNASGTLTTDEIIFYITNKSAFSYFEVGLEVLLYVNDSLVGFENTTIAPLRSGQTEEIKIHSSPRGIAPTRIEVIPVVDYFSSQSYIQVGK